MQTFLIFLYRLLYFICEAYSLLIIIDAFMSWIPAISESAAGRWIDRIVNPFVNLFRQGPILRLIYATGIDISPMIALFVIYFVQSVALGWLFSILGRIFL
ncbi:YggT family protein [Lactobacillus delbrueckii]|jgi:YggT family protein|uniref:YggT family protein n=1 Tax=Lactobacillus delbrueckii TaxID=1584 RepID=UPI001E5E37AD|nr:YggT family protein [Lactobacillus delbrueckii]MCD5532608.1 YggT family protein [Lactobacillus delbrueckii subsp. lactis]GHN42957.1 cell division membrane protein [Lactobacillus delbrueckii]